jgi:NodT family efflux transporter outer membrane factor (OMF) lipoprotein
VNLGDLFGTMQAFLSTLYINDFNLFGKTFRVQAEAQAPFRKEPADIGRLYVRGSQDVMIPISALTSTQFRSAPTVIQRFSGFTAAQFTGAPKPGRSSGELLSEVDSLVQARFASQGIGLGFSGQSYQERSSSGDAALVFALGLVIIFLVLAAQYESWSVPFAVLLGVPFGVLGALLGIWIRGQPNDVYFQVGLITVVGLAAKNAILIVEFANELRSHGMSLHEAAVEAARERLRPILMTSFAFILGVLPLMLASGAGAASRHSIGTGVFAGMLFATTVGIFFIPLFFRVIRGLSERGVGRHAPAAAAALLMLVLTACAVGPGYRRAPAVGAGAPVQPTGARSDSTRAFFDSLAAARRSDSSTAAAMPLARQPLAFDSSAGVAWLDIVRDTILVRLVETALHQNRTVRSAVARIEEYRALANVARAPLFPALSVNGSVGSQQVVFGAGPPQLFQATQVTGTVAWELDFWGRIRRGLQAAGADRGAQEAAERAAVLSLVSDVASGYLQLIEFDQEQAIAERTLASRRATLELARRRFAQGVISELDVRQFEAQVAAPAVTLAQAERLRAQAEHNLNVLLGEMPARVPRSASLAAAARELTVPDTLPATLLARRPDVAQAERALAAAAARIGASMANMLPALSIVGSYGSQASSPDKLFADQTKIYSLSAGVSVPVFSGGRQQGDLDAARARADQARAQYEQAVLSAYRDASDALVGVRTSRDQAAAQATQAEALRRALALAELRYGAGVASYLDVLDAQRSLFAAELAMSQAQLQQLTSAVQLYKALGGNWRGRR